jgi:hypothetical protein
MRGILRWTALAAIVPLAVTGLTARMAAAHPVGGVGVAGLKLIILDKYGLGKAKAVYVAKGDADIHKGAGGDPASLLAGSKVEIFPLSDPSNKAVYDLPGVGWLANKDTVAKYVNKLAAPGTDGAKVVVVKPSLVGKLVAKNLGDGDSASGSQGATDLDLQALTDGDTIRVVVTIVNGVDLDTHVFCSDFTGLAFKDDEGGHFKLLSKTSSAPSGCGAPPPPTTTTTTSTTSSSTTSSSTTSTTIAGCCGASRDVLSFTTGVGSGNCGAYSTASAPTS